MRLFTFLCFVFCPHVGFADDAKPRSLKTYVDEFDGKFELDWEKLNHEPAGYSLTKNPGELTLVTLQGSMWRSNERSLAPRNIFLLREPLKPTDNFEAVLRVNSFEPTGLYQQIGIVVFQDTNNFLKNTFEWRGGEIDGSAILLSTETDGEPGGASAALPVDGPVWLSIHRNGDKYTLGYSDDGESFVTVHEIEWKPASTEPKLRVGMICKKGPSSRAPDIDAVVESFTLRVGSTKDRSESN